MRRGCVFFFMLRGRPPFDWEAADTAETSAQLVHEVRAGALPFDAEDEDGVPLTPPSELAIELIRQMTCAEPTRRPNAAGVLAHGWLQTPLGGQSLGEEETCLDGAFARLTF